ncbi:MAG: hypothetical protein NVS2B9_04340 [Myxococcales bacterium]
MILLTASSAFAHEHPGKHAGSAADCKKMTRKSGKKMKAACTACVEQSGHHFHLGKVKGDRCHDDSHDPAVK